jgi:hypothetical protein
MAARSTEHKKKPRDIIYSRQALGPTEFGQRVLEWYKEGRQKAGSLELRLLYHSLHFCTIHYTSVPLLHFCTIHYTSVPFITLLYNSLHFCTIHYTSVPFTTLLYNSLHFCTIHYTSVRGFVAGVKSTYKKKSPYEHREGV